MDLPKKKEDLDKIVEEVEEEHGHEHVHEHEHEDIDDVVSVLELLVDSLNANLKSIESNVKFQGNEIAKIYKILASIVQACVSSKDQDKVKALQDAIALLKQ
jgi:uncharacterized FlaG/YvyC family protein